MQPIEQHLVDLVREWDSMDSAERRDSARGKAILHDVRLIGQTADYFRGPGMMLLRDGAETIVGNDNSINYWLESMWDGIGTWSP